MIRLLIACRFGVQTNWISAADPLASNPLMQEEEIDQDSKRVVYHCEQRTVTPCLLLSES